MDISAAYLLLLRPRSNNQVSHVWNVVKVLYALPSFTMFYAKILHVQDMKILFPGLLQDRIYGEVFLEVNSSEAFNETMYNVTARYKEPSSKYTA